MELDENRIWVTDIETLASCFLAGFKKLGKEEWLWYEISPYRNEIDGLVKWVKDSHCTIITYNGIAFDSQVIQYIADSSSHWYNLLNQEIVDFIYNFAQSLIHDQNEDGRKLPYKEAYMELQQIDLFTILGYGNQKKTGSSLKWTEYSLDMPIIEMPYHHSRRDLTEKECTETRQYCESDIRTTEAVYNLIRGRTEHSLYKGKDEIQYRLDAIKEYNLPKTAVNWSGVRLGEEIVLKGYMKESGQNIGKIWEKKKATKARHQFKFRECIPGYVNFKTAPFRNLYDTIKNVEADIWDKEQGFTFRHNLSTYSIKKGGIHTQEKGRLLKADDGYIIIDCDISSQYPNSIYKRGIKPGHMGTEWHTNYVKLIQKRTDYKEKGKIDSYYKGLADTLKLCLNGGSFGKMGDFHSVQYDPFSHFSVTIGNQFEILMLIEMLETAGIPVISANTDGLTCMFPESLKARYYEICEQWEVIVGNDKLGRLEYAEYKMIAQTSVNSYMAVYLDEKIKSKNEFSKDRQIDKDKSCRIIPIALQDFFAKGIPVKDTIMGYRNIFDFCSGLKASKDYTYMGINRKTGDMTHYKHLIRYYCSTQGEKIYKIKSAESLKPGRPKSQIEADSEHQTMFNIPFEVDNWNDYKIDYKYYIDSCNDIIDKIDPVYARDRKLKERKQLQLF